MTSLIDQYISLLFAWNSKIRLTGAADAESFFREQVAEVMPLVGWVARTENPVLVDVGSGNGLLAIPMAAGLPDRQVVALEPAFKKCVFLRAVKAALELKNLQIVQQTLENYDPERPAGDILWMARAIEMEPVLLLDRWRQSSGSRVLFFSAERASSGRVREELNRFCRIDEEMIPGEGRRITLARIGECPAGEV